MYINKNIIMKIEVIKPSKPQIKNALEYAEAGDFLLCIWFFPEEY